MQISILSHVFTHSKITLTSLPPSSHTPAWTHSTASALIFCFFAGGTSSPPSPQSSSPPSPPPVIYHCYSTLAALLSPSSSPSSTSALPSTSNPSAVRTDVYTLPGLRRDEGNEAEEEKEEKDGEEEAEGELIQRRKGKEGISSSSLPLCPAKFHIDQCTCNFEIELKGDRSGTSVQILLPICLYVVVLLLPSLIPHIQYNLNIHTDISNLFSF